MQILGLGQNAVYGFPIQGGCGPYYILSAQLPVQVRWAQIQSSPFSLALTWSVESRLGRNQEKVPRGTSRQGVGWGTGHQPATMLLVPPAP